MDKKNIVAITFSLILFLSLGIYSTAGLTVESQQSFQEKIKRILPFEKNEFYRESLSEIAKHNVGGHDFSFDNVLYTAILLHGGSHFGKLYFVSDTELFSSEDFGLVTNIQTASDNKMIQPHQILVLGNTGGTGENHSIAYILEKTKGAIKEAFSYPIQGYSVQNLKDVPNISYTVEPIYLDKAGESKFKIIMTTSANYLDPANADNILKEYGFQKPEQVFFLVLKRRDANNPASKNQYHFFDSSEKALNHAPKAFSLIDWLWDPTTANITKQDLRKLGERADTMDRAADTIPEPKLSHTQKSYLTINRFGFDVLQTEFNWVVESFLNHIKPGNVVLDAGSGYGALSRMAVKKDAIVISNDISKEHLVYNLKHLNGLEKQRFYLNAEDLRNADLPANSVDLIMFHRVLHFFSGEEIEKILLKSRSWLKPQGKLYVVMLSKDHVVFRDKIHYDAAKKWPGEDLVVVDKHLPDQAYALPKTLHVVSMETLKRNIEQLGFKVEKADYVSFKTLGTEQNRDGKEAVGIIAVKQ